MAETIDYAPLIDQRPPEGLTGWILQQGGFRREYLIYKASWEYEPLEERNRPVVEVVCTACNRTFTAEKINAGGCRCGYASAPFGWWNELTGESVIGGSTSTCPCCGNMGEVKHVGAIPNGISDHVYTTVVTRVETPGKQDRLALLEWQTERHIAKNGLVSFHHHIWTAWVVEERKIVRLMGHLRWFSTLIESKLKQCKTFLDKYGRYELLYPWEPETVLTGTTGENSKLDRYIEQGGAELVAYLALWRRRPTVENLVMQGYGKNGGRSNCQRANKTDL